MAACRSPIPPLGCLFSFFLSWFRIKNTHTQTQGGHGISLSGPQTSRTPAAPARAPPRPGERGVTVWDYEPEYVESWLNNAENKRGWSGSQVRLTRLELTIYRTEHFRPLAPNPSTPPRAAPRDLGPRDLGRSRAAPRDLGRSRTISRNPGAPRHATPPHPTSPTAAPRYLGRSRSVARAASHLLKKGRRLEAGGHAPSRAPSSPGFWPPGRRPTVAARGSRPSDGATTPRPARSPLHPAIAARAPSAAEFFPRASLGPRQRRRTSRPPTCAAITAVIVGAAPLGACACPACPPAKAGAKANSTAKAGARAKSTAWLVPRLKGSPLSLLAPPSLSLPPSLPLTPPSLLSSPPPPLSSLLLSLLLSSPLLILSPLLLSSLPPSLPQQLPRGRTGRSSLIAKLPQGTAR